jgi:hypothetical protein
MAGIVMRVSAIQLSKSPPCFPETVSGITPDPLGVYESAFVEPIIAELVVSLVSIGVIWVVLLFVSDSVGAGVPYVHVISIVCGSGCTGVDGDALAAVMSGVGAGVGVPVADVSGLVAAVGVAVSAGSGEACALVSSFSGRLLWVLEFRPELPRPFELEALPVSMDMQSMDRKIRLMNAMLRNFTTSLWRLLVLDNRIYPPRNDD